MTAQSTARLAADAHALMLEHDAATKGHAALRNAAILRLRHEYQLEPNDIAALTGLNPGTIRNICTRMEYKGVRA